MTKRIASLALVLAALALPGCSTNSQGDDASPVYLSVDFANVDAKNVNDGTPLTIPVTTLRNVLKNPGGGSSSFLDVRLDDYVVEWRRSDGGKVVPASETFAGDVLIPAGGSAGLTTFPFMTASTLHRAPLDALFPFNGGFDPETGKTEIVLVGIATFRGHTLSGQPVRGQGSFIGYFFFSATPTAARNR
jgi:hypothetical protein